MQDNLLSLHIMTVTLPRSYKQGKNRTCKRFIERLAKKVSAFNISQGPTHNLNRYKILLHLYDVPDFTSLDVFTHYAYTHAMVRSLSMTPSN